MVDMMLKSSLEVGGVMAQAASLGLVAYWFALASFSVALAAFRRLAVVYRYAAAFFALVAVVYALPLGGPFLGTLVAPLFLVGLGATRAVFALAAARACDRAFPGAFYALAFAAAGLVAGAGGAAFIVPLTLGPATSAGPVIEAAAALGLAAHAVATLPFLFLARGRAPAAARLLWGAVPWAACWLAAAAASLATVLGLALPASVAPLARALAPAGDGLLGLGLLLSSMLELARPAPEDTALDDYAERVGASMRRFIPTEFLDHLQKADFFELKLGDHVKKEMTIFFSDIRAFTELSERLTPEESFAFINSYLSRVVPIINEHGGFIDKYMGDGIMALFAEGGGADAAVESAVEMQVKMIEYNGHRAKMDYRPISMGIGIHTGPLMLGVVGVSDRMEGTVISDAVNLSSRLQSIAKAFNIPLVISERTFMQLDDPGKYKYRFIGKVRVKGKDAPVSVFEIFDGLPEELFERKMKSNTFFEQGMMAYYQKDYSQGVFYFKRALEAVPDDGASRFYLETCLRKAMAPRPAVSA